MANGSNKRSPKEDRRMVRTKKCLADALKQLILEKDYDSITVQDIIDRANVGRSTFYTHYESKEQLLIGNINFQQQLIYLPDEDGSPMGINIHYLFEHTREHLPLFKAMRQSKAVEILGNYFTELCAGKIFEHLQRHSPGSKKEEPMLSYKAEAAAGGIIRMLFKWLDDGARVPAAAMILYSKKILADLSRETDLAAV
jgi:hypothetical protein